MGFFSKLKGLATGRDVLEEAEEEGYVELDTSGEQPSAKIIVRPFVIQDFEGIKPILDALREGHTIALVNIKPLKDKDLVELKRAINKLKKTADAIDGDIAGFGEDWIAIVPAFATIQRAKREDSGKKYASREEVSEFSSSGSDESTENDESNPKIEPY